MTELRRRQFLELTVGFGSIAVGACGGGTSAGTVAGPISAPTPAPAPSSTTAFPLTPAPGQRYLVDANAQPFPILGRTAWAVVSLSAANYQSFIDDTVAKGYNTIEVAIPHHWPQANASPYANAGALLPFATRLDGGTWSGALTYFNINNEAPDFTKLKEPYWAFADALIDYAASKGVLALVFLCYNGAGGGTDGWMQEMVANGPARMQAFGQAIGTRWAQKKNIVWMLAGDYGSGANPYTSSQANAEDAFIAGLTAVPKASNLYSAELRTESTGKQTSTALLNSTLNLNGAYSWDGKVGTWARTAYAEAGGPAFLLEEPYDEEGPDGNNVNRSATQPVRRFQWWGWLNCIGGYVSGNGYVWQFNSGYASHLNTQGAQDMVRLNAFINSIEWWRLIPSGMGSIGTLVTAGGGSIDTTDYVAAAATSSGDLLVAYIGPNHTGSVTIDMTKLRGTVMARWFDPTSGAYTAVGTFANPGTRAFTPGGFNSARDGDWILRLDAS